MSKQRTLTTNQMLVINMFASVFSYLVTFVINFFLSPYLVRTVGVEAYGFIGLANNFVSYAALAAVALNSVAGRFITVRFYENDLEGANKYYSSVFYADAIISFAILVVETVIWISLDSIIVIPDSIFWDVKILFAALFTNCIISTLGSVFTVATFAKNRLYLSSIRTIESNLLRAVVLLVLFLFFKPHVWYIGFVTLAASIYCLLFNIRYMHILTPELKIGRRYFDASAVKEVVSSGIWNLIGRLGVILSEGLDLLITNLFIDASSMGILALAKTVPNFLSSIIGSMVGAFSPNFTILYAQGKKDELVAAVKQSMKIMGVLANLPVIVLAVCGMDFFSLWQPTQNAKLLHVLSLLTIAGIILNGGINCIFSIFTVVNKLKVNSIAILISGFLNTIITFLLIKNTGLGIYAIAGTSTVITVLRNLFITIPYSAKCLDLKWYVFFPHVLRPVLFFSASVIICSISTTFLTASTWLILLLKCTIVGCISLMIGFFIVLNKSDRKNVADQIRHRAY